MEKVQTMIRKYEDIISTVLQLLICVAAVFLALKNDKNIGRKERAKIAKKESKIKMKELKTASRIKQKTMKLSAKNDLKIQKAKFRLQQQKATSAK